MQMLLSFDKFHIHKTFQRLKRHNPANQPSVHEDYNTNPGHTEHRIDNANMGESVMVSNSNPLADGNHQKDATFF
jgi:hypothetical protein